MFEIDTQVSHPGHGACMVTDICELNMTGETVQYYKLVPYSGACETMYIPIASARKIGVRNLISKSEAYTLLSTLRDSDEPWIPDPMEKNRHYRALFADNSIENLRETLSTMGAIVRRKAQKELGSADKTMLENIQRKVMSELAAAMEISLADAIQQAERLILQAQ